MRAARAAKTHTHLLVILLMAMAVILVGCGLFNTEHLTYEKVTA